MAFGELEVGFATFSYSYYVSDQCAARPQHSMLRLHVAADAGDAVAGFVSEAFDGVDGHSDADPDRGTFGWSGGSSGRRRGVDFDCVRPAGRGNRVI